MVDDGCWSAVKVFDENFRRVDAQMVVNRGQEVARATDPFDRILAQFVRAANETTCFDTATGPDV